MSVQARLLEPELEDLGGDRDSVGNWRLRRLIGFMPEAEALVPGLTGIEYVALAGELYGMPRREAQRRAHEVLSYLELEEARYRRVEEYSAGMKQRAKTIPLQGKVRLSEAVEHLVQLSEATGKKDEAARWRKELEAVQAASKKQEKQP